MRGFIAKSRYPDFLGNSKETHREIGFENFLKNKFKLRTTELSAEQKTKLEAAHETMKKEFEMDDMPFNEFLAQGILLHANR